MPHYDYECKKCGHTFELFQQMIDKPRKRCPQCRGAVRRLIGAGAGFIFKGSGFYATDYKKSSGKNASSEDTKKSSDKTAAPTCPNSSSCGSPCSAKPAAAE